MNTAAQLLAEPGSWCQGASRRGVRGATAQRCLVAALYDAYGDRVVENIALQLSQEFGMASVEEARVGKLAQLDLTRWNDEQERTHAEVLAVAKRGDEIVAAGCAEYTQAVEALIASSIAELVV